MADEPTLIALNRLLAKKALPTQSSVYLDRPVILPTPEDSAAARRQFYLRHPAAHYLLSLRSAESRRTQGGQLRKLARLLGAPDWHVVDWAGLGDAGAHTLLARLAADEPSQATFNAARSALRGVIHQAFLLGLVDHETLLRIQSIKGESLRRRQTPAGRYLSRGEISKLFDACDDGTMHGIRDKAIIATLFYAGLRRAEVAALSMADVRLGEVLVVKRGKGRKSRQIPMITQATGALEAWYLRRGPAPGHFFRRVSRKGRILKPGISAQTVYNIVKKRAGSISCSPHDARRTFVSRLLEASQDLSAARRLAGHESTDTTVLYDRRAEIADQKAMDKLSSESGLEVSTAKTAD